MKPSRLVLLTALFLFGCSPAASDLETEETASATTAAREPATEGPSPIAQAGASDLVERWALAQNEGDFDAYKVLYASTFQGVKRSGARVQHFDLDGWLADREGMFTRPMQVEIRRLRIQASATSVHVTFEQHFSSKRYEDAGPKSLVLGIEGGRLRIMREEMLGSQIVTAGQPAPASFGEMAHVIDAGGPYAVMAVPVEDDWQKGAPTLVRRGPPTVVVAPMDTRRLPVEARALQGAQLRLMRADGVACEGIVDGFDIIGRVVPPWGALDIWNGAGGEPAWSNEAIAKDAWAVAGKVLAARVKPINGNCAGALWAQAASESAPPAVTSSAPTTAERRTALALFRALPAYHQLQQSYATHGKKHPGRWEDAGEAPPKVTRWTLEQREFVAVEAMVTTGGCADFSGSLLAIYEVKTSGPRPRLELRNKPDGVWGAELTSATMIAGQPAFFYRVELSENGFLRGDDALARTDAITVPYLACDC